MGLVENKTSRKVKSKYKSSGQVILETSSSSFVQEPSQKLVHGSEMVVLGGFCSKDAFQTLHSDPLWLYVDWSHVKAHASHNINHFDPITPS